VLAAAAFSLRFTPSSRFGRRAPRKVWVLEPAPIKLQDGAFSQFPNMRTVYRRRSATLPPIDRSWYAERLDITEYDQIVDWEALRAGRYGKAVGRRGGRPSEIMNRLRALRQQELMELYGIPPAAPPLAPTPAPAPPPAPAVSAYEQPTSPTPPAPTDLAEPLIEEVDLTAAPSPAPPEPMTPMNAATSYIQKIGTATSKFMLEMTSATQQFVNNVQQSAGGGEASSSGSGRQTCTICYEPLAEPYFGRCSHVFCRGCLMHQAMGTREQLEGTGGMAAPIQSLLVRKCPQCRRVNVPFYKMLVA